MAVSRFNTANCNELPGQAVRLKGGDRVNRKPQGQTGRPQHDRARQRRPEQGFSLVIEPGRHVIPGLRRGTQREQQPFRRDELGLRRKVIWSRGQDSPSRSSFHIEKKSHCPNATPLLVSLGLVPIGELPGDEIDNSPRYSSRSTNDLAEEDRSDVLAHSRSRPTSSGAADESRLFKPSCAKNLVSFRDQTRGSSPGKGRNRCERTWGCPGLCFAPADLSESVQAIRVAGGTSSGLRPDIPLTR